MAEDVTREFVRAVGRGVRDFALFTLIVFGLIVAAGVVSEATQDDPPELLVQFAAAFAMFIGLVSIPGLIWHRVLIRRREQDRPVSRWTAARLALVILVSGSWWIAWMTWSDGLDTLWVAGVVVVASVLYGALVPRRPGALAPLSSRGPASGRSRG